MNAINTKVKRIMKRTFIVFISIVLVLLTLPFLINVSKAEKHTENPFENSCFREINNTIIHYRYWPAAEKNKKGEWIMLIHGLGGSTYSWELNSSYFADQGYDVIAVDVPPFGYSDRDPDLNHSTDNRARLLIELMKSIDEENKWYLVGHSMGGAIVLGMGIIDTVLIEKIVFVAPALFTELKNERSLSKLLLMFKPFERVMAAVGEQFYIKPNKIEEFLFSSYGQAPTQKQVDEYYKALKVPGTAIAFIRAFTKSKVTTPLYCSNFHKKSLVICGEHDTWVPFDMISETLEKINPEDIIIIENAFHCPMETHDEVFNKIVIDFLNSE